MAENERKLYVANLPPDIAEEEILEVFNLYGPVEEVHINVPRDNRAVRSAFVRFAEPQDAAAAMAVLSDMYKFREDSVATVRVSVARPSTALGPSWPSSGPYVGKAGAGKGLGDTEGDGVAGGLHIAEGCSGGAPVVSGDAVGVPLPQPVGGGPLAPGPPVGGGGEWPAEGYGRAHANGKPDGGGRWAGGQSPEQGAVGTSGGRDPISGRDLNAKLWVGNLPGDITREVLEKVFGTYGQVEEVNILPAKSRSGQLCAFVHYATPQQADTCITAMQAGYELRPGEGELKVERPASRGKGAGCYGSKDGQGKGVPRRYQPY